MVTQDQRRKFNEEVVTPPYSLLDDILDWVSDQLSPEQVFRKSDLEQWAYDNGFKKFE